jgi:hypothetical protein
MFEEIATEQDDELDKFQADDERESGRNISAPFSGILASPPRKIVDFLIYSDD